MPAGHVLEPFSTIFVARLEEIRRLVSVSSLALRMMNGAASLLEVLEHEPGQVEELRGIEELALAEAQADFPLLHSAATVLLWGALEAAIRDSLVRWLGQFPEARQVPELNAVRVRVAEYESLDGEDRMRYILGALERELGASLKPGPGRFDCLLKPFGIDPRIEDIDRRSLSELAAVRNVLVHRAGRADRRFVELCPWMNLKEGAVIQISHDAFAKYVRAAAEYARATVISAHKLKPELRLPRAPIEQVPVTASREANQNDNT
jgi:hypothetical protein